MAGRECLQMSCIYLRPGADVELVIKNINMQEVRISLFSVFVTYRNLCHEGLQYIKAHRFR